MVRKKNVCDVWGSSRDTDLPLNHNTCCCCCLVLTDKVRREPAPRPFRAPDQLLHQQAVALRLAREGRHRWGLQVDPPTAPALVRLVVVLRRRRRAFSFICPPAVAANGKHDGCQVPGSPRCLPQSLVASLALTQTFGCLGLGLILAVNAAVPCLCTGVPCLYAGMVALSASV